MKIALVILHADTSRGGAERYTLDLAAALVQRGHRVAILASSFQTGKIAADCVLLNARGRTRTGRYRDFLDSLDEHLEQVKYDIVHAMLPIRQCDLYHPHAGVAAEAVAAGHRTKAGVFRQTAAWLGNRCNRRRKKFAQVERELLGSQHPPVVVCLSGLIQSVVKRFYPRLPTDRMKPLFNGIDLARFDPAVDASARQEIRSQYGIADSTVVGLMLAQDFERKGLAQTIKAVSQVGDPALALMVGGKPDASRYRQLALRENVQDRVIFCGPVNRTAAFYRAADFFVLPTRFDPCSLVVLEALAMGLPVISTRQNGACEIMTDGVHGWILPDPDDLLALENAIRLVLKDSQRKQISENCLKLRPAFSQQAHLDRLESLYNDALKK